MVNSFGCLLPFRFLPVIPVGLSDPALSSSSFVPSSASESSITSLELESLKFAT